MVGIYTVYTPIDISKFKALKGIATKLLAEGWLHIGIPWPAPEY